MMRVLARTLCQLGRDFVAFCDWIHENDRQSAAISGRTDQEISSPEGLYNEYMRFVENSHQERAGAALRVLGIPAQKPDP